LLELIDDLEKAIHELLEKGLSKNNKNTAEITKRIRPIQSGAVTHHHHHQLQAIVPTSFRIRKTMKRTAGRKVICFCPL
jgi:hypothetical protein